MGYNHGDSFPFDFEPNGIQFGLKSKEKLTQRSGPIQYERRWKNSFLGVGKIAVCFVIAERCFMHEKFREIPRISGDESASLLEVCPEYLEIFFKNIWKIRLKKPSKRSLLKPWLPYFCHVRWVSGWLLIGPSWCREVPVSRTTMRQTVVGFLSRTVMHTFECRSVCCCIEGWFSNFGHEFLLDLERQGWSFVC